MPLPFPAFLPCLVAPRGCVIGPVHLFIVDDSNMIITRTFDPPDIDLQRRRILGRRKRGLGCSFGRCLPNPSTFSTPFGTFGTFGTFNKHRQKVGKIFPKVHGHFTVYTIYFIYSILPT